MNQENEEWLGSTMLDGRNKILGEFLDFTFDEALRQVNDRFETQKEFPDRLALMAAKSWLIRKKVYSIMHEPFVFSIGDLENLDISPTISEHEEDSLAASLFDDDDDHDDDDVIVEAPKKNTKKAAKKVAAENIKQPDDTNKPQMVQISIIKNMTLNGVKLVKNMELEVSSADAGKLVAENKARIVE